MKRRVAGVLFLATVCLPVFAQQARDTAGQPQASGRIAGTVVSAESGRPVRFARVTLIWGNGEREAVTGDSGEFVFDRLGAGSYILRVSRLGYLDTQYGQVRPGTQTSGKRIRLAEREQIERLTIPLSFGGAISGVVRDDHGDPIFGAGVRVSRWVMRNGVRELERVSNTETDERGRYRISPLPPRSYVLSVVPEAEMIPETKAGPPVEGFAPVFYPGVMSARGATAIDLGLDEERSNVDLQVPLVALGRINGVVLGLDGRPAPRVKVLLRNPDQDSGTATDTDGNGRFSFDRVPPGAYLVHAGSNGSGHASFTLKRASLDGKAYVIANKIEMELVSIRDAIEGARIEERRGNPRTDVGTATGDAVVTGNTTTDVVLPLEAPRTVAGRILTDGASRPPVFAQMIVRLTDIRSGAIYDVKAGQDGTFTVTGVPPGQYRVDLDGEITPWNLSTALSGGVEVLDFPLAVPSGRDVRDLIFTLRDKHTELAGAVVDPASKPVTDRVVILFPSDERLWPAGERRVRACRLTEDGKYQFGDLPPGAYLLAVTESVEPDEWLDLDFLKKLLPASVPVTIALGEKKVQDLRIR